MLSTLVFPQTVLALGVLTCLVGRGRSRSEMPVLGRRLGRYGLGRYGLGRYGLGR